MIYLKGDKGDKGATSLFLSQGAKKTEGDNSDTHLYRCVAMSSMSRAELSALAIEDLESLATQAHGPYINSTHVCAGYTCVPIGQGPDGLARAILELTDKARQQQTGE